MNNFKSDKGVKVTIEPPDRKHCQAELPNGYTFMTLGGTPGLVRCPYKPVFIAYEIKAGPDGMHGSMSLCQECFVVLLKQRGLDNLRLEAINLQ